MRSGKNITGWTGLLLGLSLFSAPLLANYAPDQRAEVRQLIDQLVSEQRLPRDWLEQTFAQASKRDDILELISRPAERVLEWHEYQTLFLTPQRIEAGRDFMQQHAETLARADQVYGVPPEIITAIIGVETFYGRNKGRHRVLDALSTLTFDYPPRAAFFRGQLIEFLRLSYNQQLVPTELMGSYAGAMGYPQFIPTSYRDFAVDFDEDGRIDIWNNPVDAIGSVARYFQRHGWRSGEAVVVPAVLQGQGEALTDLRRNRFNRQAFSEVQAAGFEPVAVLSLAADTQVLPMALRAAEGEVYYLGLPNFYVITRYNHSRLYAMAVHELAEALKEE